MNFDTAADALCSEIMDKLGEEGAMLDSITYTPDRLNEMRAKISHEVSMALQGAYLEGQRAGNAQSLAFFQKHTR